jgi:hypothetical protein
MAMLGQASSLVLVRLGSFDHFPAKSCVKNWSFFSKLDGETNDCFWACKMLTRYLVKHTKMDKNIPNYHKIYQMATKYTK